VTSEGVAENAWWPTNPARALRLQERKQDTNTQCETHVQHAGVNMCMYLGKFRLYWSSCW